MARALLFAAFVCAAATALAEIGPPADLPSQARGAARVVIGQVSDVQARFETNRFGDQLIVSTLAVDVLETLKGPALPQVRVAVEGGTVGDLTLKVSDLPQLERGQRAVFFLAGDEPFEPYERGRGILKLAADDRVEGSSATLDDVRAAVRSALAQGGR
jgi:hypothetical protein